MRQTRRTVGDMEAPEFRRLMVAAGVRLEELARLSGRSLRTLRAYYYGERFIPADVSADLRRLSQLAESEGLARAQQALVSRDIGQDAVADRIARLVVERLARRVPSAAEMEALRAAVAAMCADCVGDDRLCRQADCPLRDVSPLPLAKARAA